MTEFEGFCPDISYLAVNQVGYNASEVARKLRISRMGVGKYVDRVKKILLCCETIFSHIIGEELRVDLGCVQID